MESDLLKLYYRRLFPHALFSRWLSLNDFKKREISFTLNDNRCIRYLSFNDYNKFTTKLLAQRPLRISLGAVYPIEPQHKSQLSSSEFFKPLKKEMVFDIDLTAYDNIRICCTGANVCEKCWKFMSIACQILDQSLRDDFGCKNILWAFSGRSGIHCWIADEFISKLNKIERSVVTEYYYRVKGGHKIQLPENHKMHPFLSKAIKIIDKYFLTIITEQNVLGDEQLDVFLNIIDISNRKIIKEKLLKFKTSEERWFAFLSLIKQKNEHESKYLVETIKLQYGYPRIAVNVSKDMGHLLKAPFTVDPYSDKICVTFEVKSVDGFDPNNAPSLCSLINELKTVYCDKSEELQIDCPDLRKHDDYKKTSLRPYIAVYERFIEKLEEKK